MVVVLVISVGVDAEGLADGPDVGLMEWAGSVGLPVGPAVGVALGVAVGLLEAANVVGLRVKKAVDIWSAVGEGVVTSPGRASSCR